MQQVYQYTVPWEHILDHALAATQHTLLTGNFFLHNALLAETLDLRLNASPQTGLRFAPVSSSVFLNNGVPVPPQQEQMDPDAVKPIVESGETILQTLVQEWDRLCVALKTMIAQCPVAHRFSTVVEIIAAAKARIMMFLSAQCRQAKAIIKTIPSHWQYTTATFFVNQLRTATSYLQTVWEAIAFLQKLYIKTRDLDEEDEVGVLVEARRVVAGAEKIARRRLRRDPENGEGAEDESEDAEEVGNLKTIFTAKILWELK